MLHGPQSPLTFDFTYLRPGCKDLPNISTDSILMYFSLMLLSHDHRDESVIVLNCRYQFWPFIVIFPAPTLNVMRLAKMFSVLVVHHSLLSSSIISPCSI
jgi:hypothetical protein